MKNLIVIIFLSIAIPGCVPTNMNHKVKNCAIALDKASHINGVSFGDSMEFVQGKIAGEWKRVNIKKTNLLTETSKAYGKKSLFRDYINNGIGYNFIDNKLAGVYQENSIDVCYEGVAAKDADELVEILVNAGFELLILKKGKIYSVISLDDGKLDITIFGMSDDKSKDSISIMPAPSTGMPELPEAPENQPVPPESVPRN